MKKIADDKRDLKAAGKKTSRDVSAPEAKASHPLKARNP